MFTFFLKTILLVYVMACSVVSAEDFRSYYSDQFPDTWKKVNQCYHLDGYGFGSDLMTKKTYKDFELEFDWSLEEGGNSGVLFAVQEGEYFSYLTGLEIQLLDDALHPDGKTPKTSLGALYGLSAPKMDAKKSLKLGKMNRGLLIVKDQNVRFFVNGLLIAEYSLKEEILAEEIKASKFSELKNFYKNPRGHILFQDHGGNTVICNVKIREL